jgi:hypothetical protein
MASASPGRRWPVPDVFAACGSAGTYIDVRFTCASQPLFTAASFGAASAGPAAIVASALRVQERAKVKHYSDGGALSAGGPMAPDRASFVPFIVETGGQLAPAAQRLLRDWARIAAGDAPRGDDRLSPAACARLRCYHILLATTIHRWQACCVHQAAEWLSDDTHSYLPASPTVLASSGALAPRAPPRGLSLADIDHASPDWAYDASDA